MAKILLIVGSVRRDRQGIKVARWVDRKLKERGHTVFFVDPMELQLPLLDRMYKEMENPPEELRKLRNQIKEADGYLAVTPEYNHSTSSAMKNTLDHFLEEYFFKPSAIISYSAGSFGGVRATEHLRNIFAELGAPAIPSSLPVPKVQDILDDDGNMKEEANERRLSRLLDEFEWYMEALRNQREKGTPY